MLKDGWETGRMKGKCSVRPPPLVRVSVSVSVGGAKAGGVLISQSCPSQPPRVCVCVCRITYIYTCVRYVGLPIGMLILLHSLQREARGSVTFKIVPSYRSAPPPCEVRLQSIHTYARPSDLYPFLRYIRFSASMD